LFLSKRWVMEKGSLKIDREREKERERERESIVAS
jgi:hypothetical protein